MRLALAFQTYNFKADNGSCNNQCDKKCTTVKQSIKSSLNAVLARKANRKMQIWRYG